MELNAEQIIKALEYCGAVDADISTCDRCPFEPKEEGKGSLGCNDELIRNSLALIKELTAKTEAQDLVISELRHRAEKAEHDAERYSNKIKELSDGYNSPTALELLEEIETVALSKIDAELSVSTLDDTYYIQALDELKEKYSKK